MEYPSNSYKTRSERLSAQNTDKKVEPVVTGIVKKKKKSELQKAKDTFFLSDLKSIGSYCVKEVLVPSAKKILYELVTNGCDMLLYGETSDRKKTRSSRLSYRSFFDRDDDDRRKSSRRTTSRFDLDDVILSTKQEAENVLDRMDDLIDRYGIASVGDFKSLINERSEHTDEKFGWTSFKSADIVRIRDGREEGYLIRLPKAYPID